MEEEKEEMNLSSFFKIDRSMGESRFSQLCGAYLLVGTILAAWLYKEELRGGAQWLMDLF